MGRKQHVMIRRSVFYGRFLGRTKLGCRCSRRGQDCRPVGLRDICSRRDLVRQEQPLVVGLLIRCLAVSGSVTAKRLILQRRHHPFRGIFDLSHDVLYLRLQVSSSDGNDCNSSTVCAALVIPPFDIARRAHAGGGTCRIPLGPNGCAVGVRGHQAVLEPRAHDPQSLGALAACAAPRRFRRTSAVRDGGPCNTELYQTTGRSAFGVAAVHWCAASNGLIGATQALARASLTFGNPNPDGLDLLLTASFPKLVSVNFGILGRALRPQCVLCRLLFHS